MQRLVTAQVSNESAIEAVVRSTMLTRLWPFLYVHMIHNLCPRNSKYISCNGSQKKCQSFQRIPSISAQWLLQKPAFNGLPLGNNFTVTVRTETTGGSRDIIDIGSFKFNTFSDRTLKKKWWYVVSESCNNNQRNRSHIPTWNRKCRPRTDCPQASASLFSWMYHGETRKVNCAYVEIIWVCWVPRKFYRQYSCGGVSLGQWNWIIPGMRSWPYGFNSSSW